MLITKFKQLFWDKFKRFFCFRFGGNAYISVRFVSQVTSDKNIPCMATIRGCANTVPKFSEDFIET